MVESKYKSLEGSFVVKTVSGGSLCFGVNGSQVPDDVGQIPAYLAELARRELTGATSGEVENLHKRIKELEQTVDKKIGEISELKKIAKVTK